MRKLNLFLTLLAALIFSRVEAHNPNEFSKIVFVDFVQVKATQTEYVDANYFLLDNKRQFSAQVSCGVIAGLLGNPVEYFEVYAIVLVPGRELNWNKKAGRHYLKFSKPEICEQFKGDALRALGKGSQVEIQYDSNQVIQSYLIKD